MSGVLAIVQARYGSSRLPGKVLAQIGDHTLLEHVVSRTQQAVQDVVVATPNDTMSAHVYLYAKEKLKVAAYLYEGYEADVLGRYAACARQYMADVVVRITSDCPFIDSGMIGLLVGVQQATGADYVSNLSANRQIDGLDCEVFTRAMLERADKVAESLYDREHVTPWIRKHAPHVITVDRTLLPLGSREHRWTVDMEADLEWCNRIAEHIDVIPGTNVVPALIELITTNPELARYSDAGTCVAA